MRQLKDAVRDVLLDVKRTELEERLRRQRQEEVQTVVEGLVPLAVARALSAHFDVWVPASALRVLDVRLTDTSAGPIASVTVSYVEAGWDACGYALELHPAVMVNTTTWAVTLPDDLPTAWRPLRYWDSLAYPLGFVEAAARVALDAKQIEGAHAETRPTNGHVVSAC